MPVGHPGGDAKAAAALGAHWETRSEKPELEADLEATGA